MLLQIIALPVSVQTKPGEVAQQQTLQIQVVNPANNASGGDKYSLPLSLQHFQQGQVIQSSPLHIIQYLIQYSRALISEFLVCIATPILEGKYVSNNIIC